MSVSFTLEVSRTGMVDTMVVETDLHLNTKHPDHDAEAVNSLLQAARDYLAAKAQHATNIRIKSIRSDQT